MKKIIERLINTDESNDRNKRKDGVAVFSSKAKSLGVTPKAKNCSGCGGTVFFGLSLMF